VAAKAPISAKLTIIFFIMIFSIVWS